MLIDSTWRIFRSAIHIPLILTRLGDEIYGQLREQDTWQWFARAFFTSIRPGVDLSVVADKFAIYLLTDPKRGLTCFAKTDGERAALRRIADLYRQKMAGKEKPLTDWVAAFNAALAAGGDNLSKTRARDEISYAIDVYHLNWNNYAGIASEGMASFIDRDPQEDAIYEARMSRHHAALAIKLIELLRSAA